MISRRFSEVSHYSHGTDFGREDSSFLQGLLSYCLDDPVLLSPSDSSFEGFNFSPFSPTELLDSHGEDAPSEESQAATSTAVVPRSKSLNPDLAMIAPCPVGSPLLDFSAPTFSEFSDKQNRRALVDHFCNVLSHLIVFREETGNPFQQLVLPLTQGSSPVKYAIFALACAHLEYRGVENAEKSLYFHNMAIRGVAQLIQHSSKANRNEILAAIMLLVYYECVSLPLVSNPGYGLTVTACPKRTFQYRCRPSQGGPDHHGHRHGSGRLDKRLLRACMWPLLIP
jgi:hypothetical protein